MVILASAPVSRSVPLRLKSPIFSPCLSASISVPSLLSLAFCRKNFKGCLPRSVTRRTLSSDEVPLAILWFVRNINQGLEAEPYHQELKPESNWHLATSLTEAHHIHHLGRRTSCSPQSILQFPCRALGFYAFFKAKNPTMI